VLFFTQTDSPSLKEDVQEEYINTDFIVNVNFKISCKPERNMRVTSRHTLKIFFYLIFWMVINFF